MFLGALAAVSLLTACAVDRAVPISSAEIGRGIETYRLGPGDKLRISVYNEPAMTGEYAISTTGAVDFPLIGQVTAGGRSIVELGDAIAAKLTNGFVNDPHVSVEVLAYRPYFVLGEVIRAGEYPFSGDLTIEQAVAAAGGYTFRANQTKVYLRRRGEDVEHSVNLRGKRVTVLPGDTIRVGERYF
jgi:polysaccharide export outer membrane protein